MRYMTNNPNGRCSSCQSVQNDSFPSDMPVAMAYVPWQNWNNLYDLDKALAVGTIFPCLNRPFLGRSVGK